MESSTVTSNTVRPSHTIDGTCVSFKARQRQYALTCEKEAFVHYKDIVKYMTSRKKPNYYLVCAHDGPEYEHIHMYFQYDNPKNIDSKNLYGAHIETHVWSPQAYVSYCKGEDDKHKSLGVTAIVIDEEGELRKKGNLTVQDLKEIDDPSTLDWRMHNTWEKIHRKQKAEDAFIDMLEEIEKDELKAPDVYYIYGLPGQGKTYGAYKLALKQHNKKDIGRIKFDNGFASITNEDAKCFVIEEFRPADLRASILLQFIDKYGTELSVKGGFVSVRPKCIIICSFIKPYELYKNEELSQQFIRRITKFYIARGQCIEEISEEQMHWEKSISNKLDE